MKKSLGLDKNRVKNELVGYFIITLVLSYLIFSLIIIGGKGINSSPGFLMLYILGISVPSLCGIFLTVEREGKNGLKRLWYRCKKFNIGLKWYIIIIAINLSLRFGSFIINNLLNGFTMEYKQPNQIIANPVFIIPTIIMLIYGGPISEEFGWRGFALDRLQSKYNPLFSSIILGGIWGIWHILLFYMPGTIQYNNSTPFILFLVQTVSIAVIYTWIYNSTGKSIWAIILFHFMSNLIATLFPKTPREFLYYTLLTVIVAIIILVIKFKEFIGTNYYKED